MRARRWIAPAGLGLLAGACDPGSLSGGASTFDQLFASSLDGALAPGAVTLLPPGKVDDVAKVRALAVDADTGTAIAIVGGAAAVAGAPFAHVGEDGAVTRIVADDGTKTLADASFGAPTTHGAFFATCSDAWLVDRTKAVARHVAAPSSLCGGARVGRSLRDDEVLVLSGAREVRRATYGGTTGTPTETTLSTFGGPGYAEWVEEIAQGVAAWVVYAQAPSSPMGTWTYGRSDGAASFTAPLRSRSPRIGLTRFVRDTDGSLLLADPSVGLVRWHVESDGRLETISAWPAAPYGAWSPFGTGRALSIETSAADGGATVATGRSAWVHVAGGALAVAALRASPCADAATCARLGETATIAAAGPAGAPVAVQRVWGWIDGAANREHDVAAVVAAGGTASGTLPAVDAGSDDGAGGIDASDGGAGGMDASDGGATDGAGGNDAGACPHACGAGDTCDPLGACDGVLLAGEPALSVGASSAGVAWLVLQAQAGIPGTGAVRWLAAGATQPETIASGLDVGATDRFAVDGADVYFTTKSGLSRAGSGKAVVSLAGSGAQPDALHLAGATTSAAYAWWTRTSFESLLRFDRASDAQGLAGCAALGVYDACADGASDGVLVSTGTQIQRFGGNAPGGTCSSASPGPAVVSSAGPQEGLLRVVATSTRISWVSSSASGTLVRSTDSSGGASPTDHGATRAFTVAGQDAYPLAASGDTVYFVSRDPAAPGSPQYKLVASTGTGQPTNVDLAIVTDPVSAIAVTPTSVVWADGSGVRQVAR